MISSPALLAAKNCTHCGAEKSLDEFYSSPTSRDGRTSWCKECVCPKPQHPPGRLVKGSSRRAHAAVVEWEQKTGQRVCTRCEQTKPLIEGFHRDPQSRMGRSTRCRECKNPQARAQSKRYRAAKPEQCRETVREWQRHPDRNEKRRAAYAADPLPTLAKNARRRALRLAADGDYTAAEFEEMCAKYGNVCLCCGADGPLEADHVIPLTWGGGNGIDNIQPLCRSCNSRKGNRHATDYRVKVA